MPIAPSEKPATVTTPTSYLSAAGDALTASGAHTWTLTGSSGADVAIDAGDHTKIDFNTTGLYVVAYQSSFDGDATGAGLSLARPAWSAAPDWAAHVTILSPEVVIAPPSYEEQFLTMLPPLLVNAGVWLQISPIVAASAGTITVNTTIVVRRIA